MFRSMRRVEKQTTIDEAEELLKHNDYGVLSVLGDDGFPYGVPINYVYDEGKIYMHGTSSSSHKAEAIRRDPKVCLTVVNRHDLVPAKMSTDFASVIVFGSARIVSSKEESLEALRVFLTGLAPEKALKASKIYEGSKDRFVMIELTPEHITGKVSK